MIVIMMMMTQTGCFQLNDFFSREREKNKYECRRFDTFDSENKIK